MLKLYNTLSRKKEEFQPLKKDFVGMYACGPTVYWFAHIGNMRAFLLPDLIRRTLEYNGFDVRLIMNITDVGHLTDDADSGEDKMLVAMQREGKTAYEIAEFYTQAFLKDLDRLNIVSAHEYPKATEHIQEQIDMIKKIELNGFAYETSDGVYFDTSKLPSYGVLSGQDAAEKMAGVRVDMKEKKNATDFALWKLSPKDAIRQMEWDSPWGKGFPGWHIECTAMSTKYLSTPFDIHTGGIDHVPVHHENELAQSVGACGAYHSRFWIHNEFLAVNDGKMSKSLGNLFTLEDLIKKGFDPLAFRYFVLGGHYRTKLNFSWESLEAAQNALHRLQETVRDLNAGKKGAKQYEQRFLEALNDDLNTPKAIAVVWEMIDDATVKNEEKAASLLKFDDVLGFGLADYLGKPVEIPEEIHTLIEARQKARAEKDFERSDQLRDEIEEKGYLLEDTDQGPKVRLNR